MGLDVELEIEVIKFFGELKKYFGSRTKKV